MIENPPILTIRKEAHRPTAAQITAFRDVPTGFVADAMNGVGALSGITPLCTDGSLPRSMSGPALTVHAGPGDVLATLAGLGSIRASDIMVIAFDAYQGCAAAGDRVMGMSANNGGVGLVTDGPMRDYDGIVEAGLPVWCSGLTPNSPQTTGPGAVGLPVQIGGRTVDTGDMIVADRDGVVVVPFEQLDDVIARLPDIHELETALDARVADGLTMPDHIRDLLASEKVRSM